MDFISQCSLDWRSVINVMRADGGHAPAFNLELTDAHQ